MPAVTRVISFFSSFLLLIAHGYLLFSFGCARFRKVIEREFEQPYRAKRDFSILVIESVCYGVGVGSGEFMPAHKSYFDLVDQTTLLGIYLILGGICTSG